MEPIFHLLPDAPKPVAPYSHAVEAGPFVFVTGYGAETSIPPAFAARPRLQKPCSSDALEAALQARGA